MAVNSTKICYICWSKLTEDGKCMMCKERSELDALIWCKEWEEYYPDQSDDFDYEEYSKQIARTRRERAQLGRIYGFSGKNFNYIRIEYLGKLRADVRVVDFDGYLKEFVASDITFSVRFDDHRWGNVIDPIQ